MGIFRMDLMKTRSIFIEQNGPLFVFALFFFCFNFEHQFRNSDNSASSVCIGINVRNIIAHTIIKIYIDAKGTNQTVIVIPREMNVGDQTMRFHLRNIEEEEEETGKTRQ